MVPPPPLPPEQCVQAFLNQAQRLGIAVRWKQQEQVRFDAAYFATPGTPGYIVLTATSPKPDPKAVCTLLSHEMVHVLQHWKGRFHSVEPLGWPRDGTAVGEHRWAQEQEAYTAQEHPSKVLRAISRLKPLLTQDSP